MKYGIFTVENMVEGLSAGIALYPTDKAAACYISPNLKHPDECRIWRVADYDIETRIVTPITPRLIEKDYRYAQKPVNPPESTISGPEAMKDFLEKTENK